MVFSSTIFIFAFLPVVLIGYYLIPKAGKNLWLLITSLFFYFWGGAAFFPIILYSICLNYFSGLVIDYCEHKGLSRLKKTIFVTSIILNLGCLGYWKYAGFLMQSIKDISGLTFDIPEIMLPIGISFFTFQGMSYVIDLYRKEVPVQRNPLNLGLYVALFPQLIAGPIVRYSDIEKQLVYRIHSVDKFASGIRIFSVGLAKKAIIANSVAIIADQIFGMEYWQNTPSVAWLGLIAYTFQLYFDFSGYSDMAIGLGRMFGFEMPGNFNYPLISKSITEFWRRWHISLSSWFRDYVYIPLGGSRTGNVYLNLFCVFLLTGIWHGASWNFVMWGLLFAVLIVIERFLKNKFSITVHGIGGWIYTLFMWIMSMVLFRAETLADSVLYYRSLFGLIELKDAGFTIAYYLHNYEIFILLIAAIAMLPLCKKCSCFLQKKLPENSFLFLSNFGALFLLGISLLYVVTGTYNPFIYFQF